MKTDKKGERRERGNGEKRLDDSSITNFERPILKILPGTRNYKE